MAHYRLSRAADEKISAIYEYSVLRFGEDQADDYFLGMHGVFQVLAERPLLGRQCRDLGDGIRRFLYQSHVIFYRPAANGIFIIDIFGERQLPAILSRS
jgi:toxin ParE1/3/4